MPLWIPITLGAACLQITRTTLQKSLQSRLDNYATTWVRYVFALPLLLLIMLAVQLTADNLPTLNSRFFLYCLIAGIAQIVATVMMLTLFSRSNFAIGTTFAKTEGLQIALLGVIIFNEPPSFMGGIGIVVGGVGVLLMTNFWQVKNALSIFLGLGAGFLFALTSWLIRQSYQTLDIDNAFVGAAYTLSVMVTLQSVLLGLFLWWRKTDFVAVWGVRYRSFGVGVTSILGSYGWAASFMLTNPAYVKTLAQVELPMAFLVSHLIFREKTTLREILGIIAVGIGAVFVIVG